jgi:hypothetical protein
MKSVQHIFRDFVSHEARVFKFTIGNAVASSLSGLIAGMVIASIVWVSAITFVNLGQ